jgi:glycosyltransferase involved in cell wall biosynthesis
MNDAKPQISVIVPVYNVQDYLEECIESILRQDFHDFELILVDDGSTDNSGKICDTYLDRTNVNVIHKENGGLSDARNAGISAAKGKYITFIDSDDIVWNKYLSVLHNAALAYDADIVQAELLTGDIRKLGTQKYDEKVILSGEEAFRNYLTYKTLTVSACAKLFRKELFDDVLFPVGKINEDNFTIYKYYYLSKKVVCIPEYVYYYRVHSGTIMHGKFTEKNFEVINVPIEIKEFLGERADEFTEELEYYQFRLAVWLYNIFLIHTEKNEFEQEKKEVRNKIVKTSISNKYINKKYRIYLLLLRVAPSLYRRLVLWYRGGEI